MSGAEELRKRIQGTADIGGVVRTMKALAATSVRQYEDAVGSLSVYAETIELALQAAARHIPEDIEALGSVSEGNPGAVGAIVFGTDQGMCGPFNDQIAAFAAGEFAFSITGETPDGKIRPLWAVGERLARTLQAAGLEPDEVYATPGSIDGISGRVSQLLTSFEARQRGHGTGRVDLLYHQSTGGAGYRARREAFWPVDLSRISELRRRRWESRSLPLVLMPWQEIVQAVLRQSLFIGLYRAMAESLASENASRLATMERAEKNIEERLEALQAESNYLRQQSITVELLDIVSGFEASQRSNNLTASRISSTMATS